MFEAISAFFEANALWTAACIALIAAIMIAVNIFASVQARRMLDDQQDFEDFDESFSTLST